MADEIKLQQPLGTDEYNVGVFNANFQIIQDYLNKFNGQFTSGLEVKYPTEININTVDNGIYICDFTDATKTSGTYPTGILGKLHFILISYGLYQETSQVQYYADLTYSNNKTYVRYLTQNGDWSQWAELGSGSGSTSGGSFVLQYPSKLNLNDINYTSMYVCKAFEGDIPWDNSYADPESGQSVVTSQYCFVFHYGDESELPMYQRFISTSPYKDGSCTEYIRFRYTARIGTISGHDNWTLWYKVGGDSNIDVSVVELD